MGRGRFFPQPNGDPLVKFNHALVYLPAHPDVFAAPIEQNHQEVFGTYAYDSQEGTIVYQYTALASMYDEGTFTAVASEIVRRADHVLESFSKLPDAQPVAAVMGPLIEVATSAQELVA